MTQVELRAEALTTDAIAAIESGSTLQQISLAAQIRLFLSSNRGALPAWRQDELDTALERLEGRGPGTAESQQSSIWSGVSSFMSDETSLDESIVAGAKQLGSKVGESVQEGLSGLLKTPGGKVAAGVTVALLLAYVWRAFK